jgi:hypothetical protein
MSKLQTENGNVYTELTKGRIASAINSLNTTDNTFATLERDDGSVIQVVYNGPRGYYVELQDIRERDIFRTTVNYSQVGDVVSILVRFQQEEGLELTTKWKKHKIPKQYNSPKLFNILNYIGLGVILVSLWGLLTDKSPFLQKLALLGCWLMFPENLYDAIDWVQALKVGEIDTWRMTINYGPVWEGFDGTR